MDGGRAAPARVGLLLTELVTQTRNTIRPHGADATFDQIAKPTAIQARAHELIDAYTITT